MSLGTVILYALVIFLIGAVGAGLLLRKAEKGKCRFEKFLIFVYAPLSLWSLFYYYWCLDGTGLSLIRLWPAIAPCKYFKSLSFELMILNPMEPTPVLGLTTTG